ncbi:MAG: mechanosensitive ion channel protein MscS [Rhodospirillales bacterium]|nr:MAG: mechanosensitive ion channel protein MscS [Rhodospirillales bacterium]
MRQTSPSAILVGLPGLAEEPLPMSETMPAPLSDLLRALPVDRIALESLQMRLEYWFLTEVLVWSTLGQLAVIAAALLLARLTARPLREALVRAIARRRQPEQSLRRLTLLVAATAFPIVAVLLLWFAMAVAAGPDWPRLLISTVAHLLTAWIVIHIAAALIHDETLSRLVALFAFGVATLGILDLLGPVMAALDRLGVEIADVYISVLSVLKAMVLLAVLLWLATVLARVLEQRIHHARTLTPSIQVLIGKLLKFSLIAIAFLVTLRSIGIDLTAFAIFTGALGVGVGLGLQRTVSNLISGIILLMDKSIKPGDVIEIEETFGWVSSLGARYVSVTTRDGKEWLIPNEDLITTRVINWSFTSDRLRLPLPFGVSYNSDVRKAMDLAVEAAGEEPRVLKEPAPVCRVMGFGDNSVNLELRLWIRDPVAGVVNVRSAVLLRMWDKFHANDIRIPFPQRDLHIKDADDLVAALGRLRPNASAGGGETAEIGRRPEP